MTSRIVLTSGTCTAVLTDLGARLLELHVPDRAGILADVVLQRPTFADIATDVAYLGATVGRCANRILSGRFEMENAAVQLTLNDGNNHLHGGLSGFDRRTWSSQADQDEVTFRRVSPAGEEGYPGTLATSITYRLAGSTLSIDVEATTDAPTIVNVVHHSYFNLAGHDAGTIRDHVLQVRGSAYLPVDEETLPTGEVRAVHGTPFDFRSPTVIGPALTRAIDAGVCPTIGFDHNWVLDGQGMREVAVLAHPDSGRRMTVHTDQPGLQVYTGGYLDGITGKGAVTDYGAFAGVALEPQHFPDGVNHAHFPSAVLRTDQTYRSAVRFEFSTQ